MGSTEMNRHEHAVSVWTRESLTVQIQQEESLQADT
jgi:hypothetical protein